MALNTQFSIAVHVLAGLGYRGERGSTTSELATSVNTSPSFVRRVVAKLSKAGLVRTATGPAGSCHLARQPGEITLLDVYRAVDAPKAFAIHAYPAEKFCPVSCNIKVALESVLDKTQRSMETGLRKITLAEVIHDVKCQ